MQWVAGLNAMVLPCSPGRIAHGLRVGRECSCSRSSDTRRAGCSDLAWATTWVSFRYAATPTPSCPHGSGWRRSTGFRLRAYDQNGTVLEGGIFICRSKSVSTACWASPPGASVATALGARPPGSRQACLRTQKFGQLIMFFSREAVHAVVVDDLRERGFVELAGSCQLEHFLLVGELASRLVVT